MMQNVHRRLSEIVVAYPGPSCVVATCSAVVALRAAGLACRLGKAYLDSGEKADPEPGWKETKNVFGHGAFLDGLVVALPTMEFSICESLGSYVGFEVPGKVEAERNFAELLRTCRKLPATVDGAPWLQKQIDSLRASVDLLSRTHYGAAERGDGLNAIDTLWEKAVKLRKKLKIHDQHQAYQSKTVNAAMAESTPAEHSGAADLGDHGQPYERSGLPTVKRRHLTSRADFATASPLRPSQVESFLLSEAQCRDIRAAIERAWNERDGLQRITHNEQRRLGTAIAGITGGTYPTHFSHEGPRGRRYTVQHVVLQATQYMTPWHGDAVRKECETALKELTLLAKT